MLSTKETWFQLCCLFVIIELTNVFSEATYQPCTRATPLNKITKSPEHAHHLCDSNMLLPETRATFIYARGLVSHTLDVFDKRFSTPPDPVAISTKGPSSKKSIRESLYLPLLAWILLQMRLTYDEIRRSKVKVGTIYTPNMWKIVIFQLDSIVDGTPGVRELYDSFAASCPAPQTLVPPSFHSLTGYIQKVSDLKPEPRTFYSTLYILVTVHLILLWTLQCRARKSSGSRA